MLELLARVVASTAFTVLSCLGIIGAGVWWYRGLLILPSQRLKDDLDPTRARLRELCPHPRVTSPDGPAGHHQPSPDEVEEAFPPKGPLRRAWEEFRGTLVYHDSRVWRTTSAHEFFNESRILAASFNLRHIGVTPNTLTGLGILGTFVGLVAGIYLGRQGLLLDRLDEMRASLLDLLSGASIAFWTSVVGLSSSLLFGWLSRRALNEFAAMLSELADQLDTGVELRPAEWFMADTLSEVRKQTAELRHFNTDLANSIGQALDERLAVRLVPHLQEAVSAVHRLREEQVMFNQETLDRLLQRFGEQLGQSAGREVEALVATIRDVRAGLLEVSQSLAQERATVAESWSAGLTQFEAGVRAVREQLATAGTPLMEAASRWAEHLARAEGLVRQVAETANGVREALDDTSRTVRDAVNGLASGAEGLRRLLDNASGLLETSQEATRRAQEAVADLQHMSSGLAQAATELRLQMQAITSTWEAQRERFEGLDKELASAFGRLTSGMQDALDKAGEGLGKANDYLSDALRSLGGLVEQLGEQLDEVAGSLNPVDSQKRGVASGPAS